jgi:dTDP-4-dehydrorhamnose reductase
MKKVFITGISGVLGSRLAKLFSGNGYKVYGIYYRNYPDDIGRISEIFSLDIRDVKRLDDIIDRVKPDIIIHTAALSRVGECEANEDTAYTINQEGSKNIAIASSRINAKLFHISTDLVFSGRKGNYREEDTKDPINVYGKTKHLAEEEIIRGCKNYVIMRVSLLYSYTYPHKGDLIERIRFSLSNNAILNLFTDQIRTPTAIEDIFFAILESIELGIKNEILHIASPIPLSRYDIGIKIAKAYNLTEELIIPTKMREFFVNENFIQPNCSLSVEKFYKLFNRYPISFEEGLAIQKTNIKD